VTFKLLGYEPHADQLRAHQCTERVILVAGAERGGKSFWTAEEIVARAPWCKRIAVVADEYDETRAEMEYILEGLDELGAVRQVSMPRQGKRTITTRWGCEIETVSVHKSPRQLTGRGRAYDVVAIVEAGLIGYDSFLAARGRVAETRGAVIMSGTLWDNFGWYAELFEDFRGDNVFGGVRYSFPAWANKEIFPGGREDAEIKRLEKIYTEDEFARRVAAKLVPSPARMYPEFRVVDPDTGLRMHVRDVPYAPGVPVYLAVDIGYYPSHYAVLALQFVDKSFRLASGSVVTMEVVHQIDEVWENFLGHEDVIQMCREREWWRDVACAVGGQETRQHQPGYTENVADAWEGEIGAEPGDPKEFYFEMFDAGRILDGARRVRTMLRDPATGVARYYVDEDKCPGTQSEFKAYKRRTNRQGEAISETPEDKNNDAMDALRDIIVWRYGMVETAEREPIPGRAPVAMRG